MCIICITICWPNRAISFYKGKGYKGNKGLKIRGKAVEGAKKKAELNTLKYTIRNFSSTTRNYLYNKQFITYLKKVKYNKKNKASPKRWTAESLLCKALLDNNTKKQQKLPF